ncbi:exosome nuclease subunit, partial [Coemansia aciculifera]
GGIDRVQSAVQPMQTVMQRSAQTALTLYVKDSYDAESGLGSGGWASLLRKWKQPLDARQFAVLRAIHAWRDACAREEDESTRYVLPNHMLFSLATRPPANVPALLAACHPTPPPVRMHAADLVALIARAQASSSTVQPDQPSSVADETLPVPVPVHTRFADHHVNGDILTPDIMASARDIAAQKSALFGSIASSSGDERESEAMRRAQQVRASLVLQPPAVPTAVVAATSNEPEFTPVLPSKRKRTEEAPAAPAPAPEPVVLSETYAAYHAPTIKQKKLADPSAMQLPKIALGDIDDDDSDGGSGNQLTLANK